MVKLRELTKPNIDFTASHQRPVQVQHSILDATTLSALSTEANFEPNGCLKKLGALFALTKRLFVPNRRPFHLKRRL